MVRMSSAGAWSWVFVFALEACSELHNEPPADAQGATDARAPADAASEVDARAGDAAGEEGDAGLLVPEDWPSVSGECFITLRGPALVATQGEGVDTCIANFEDEDCTYRVEYGAGVADTFANATGPDFRVEDVVVDANPARLVTALYRLDSDAYLVGVHVPAFSQDPPDFSMTASARCSSEAALETARLVLQTFDVSHVGEGPCEPVRPDKCSPI